MGWGLFWLANFGIKMETKAMTQSSNPSQGLYDPNPGVDTLPERFPAEERRGVYRAIRSRRDIRQFRPDPVPDQVPLVHKLL